MSATGETGETTAPATDRPAAAAASGARVNWIALAPWLFTLALFGIWEAAVRLSGVAVFVLPPPSVIFGAIVQYWPAMWSNSLVTLATTLVGFLMAVFGGLALGILVGWSRLIYAGLYPILIGFNAIPKVAIVPILVIWFGIGEIPAILTAFLIAFFPVTVNVATGLATIEPETEDVLRALGASKMDVMLKIGIPRAMPYFFGSLKLAITLAFVGSVISEFIGANAGLGHMMLTAQSQFNVPVVWGALIMLAVLGIGLYAVTVWIERRMTGWATRGGEAA